MRAIVIDQYGGPGQLVLRNLPDPEPQPGQVVVEVKAFGLNHAEIYFANQCIRSVTAHAKWRPFELLRQRIHVW